MITQLQSREYQLESLGNIENYRYGMSFDALFKEGHRMIVADINAAKNQDFDESLREKLASRRYAHWDALLREGYKTREDQVLRALTATLKRDYCDVINHEDRLTAPGLNDFHNALREIAIADTTLFELCGLANEGGGFEDDVLSHGAANHLFELQCQSSDRQDDDVDSLYWLVNSHWLSDCDRLDGAVENTLAALPPLTPLPMPSPLVGMASLSPVVEAVV